MTRPELFADRRSSLLVLASVTALGLMLMAVVPAFPGYLRPTSFVSIGLVVAVLAVAVVADKIGRARQMLAVVLLTAALTIAFAGSEPGPSVALYLLWYPWIAIYGGMSTSLPVASGNAAVVGTGTVSGVASQGGLAGGGGPMTLATVTSVVFAVLLVHRLSNWIRVQVDRDSLTSLANRAGLMRRADPAISRSVAQGRDAVLVLLDINRFREVNGALGYDAGDELLRLISRELRDLTPEPLFLGRLFGDEFALVMDGSTLSESPTTAIEQLRRLGRTVLGQIRGPFRVDGVAVEVEASAGIAVAPRDGDDLSTLLPCADAALHRAKRDGQRVGIWDAGIAGVRPSEIALYAELRAAISEGELVLYYQPLMSAHTGTVVGVEALVRWQHPRRGLLQPGAFLPMAEGSPLIAEVTEWVLDEALRQCASWASEGLHVPVSVNLSARMLVMDDLPSLVSDALGRHGLPHDVLTLEITESALVTQPARAASMLRVLRNQGVRFSLDDFGTGYSSMEILKAFQFDEVKIDRGFVSDVRGSPSDAAIVRTVLDLGHRLGLQVVGEGVEDLETLATMKELDCDILQGDVVSRPLPPAGLERVLAAGGVPFVAAMQQSGESGDAASPPTQASPPGGPSAGRRCRKDTYGRKGTPWSL